MKRKNRLSLALALLLALSLATPAFAADDSTYTDVYEGDWFVGDVAYAYQLGLIDGRGNAFEPNANASRGVIVQAMYRLEVKPKSSIVNQFSDVPAGSEFEDAIVWANENGIVGGYGNGKFGPDDLITREQLAAIFHRYAGYKGKDTTSRADLSQFIDADQISGWAKEDVSWANAVGIINGTSTTTISPKGTTTRSQTAAVVHRYGENTLDIAPAADAAIFVAAVKKTEPDVSATIYTPYPCEEKSMWDRTEEEIADCMEYNFRYINAAAGANGYMLKEKQSNVAWAESGERMRGSFTYVFINQNYTVYIFGSTFGDDSVGIYQGHSLYVFSGHAEVSHSGLSVSYSGGKLVWAYEDGNLPCGVQTVMDTFYNFSA